MTALLVGFSRWPQFLNGESAAVFFDQVKMHVTKSNSEKPSPKPTGFRLPIAGSWPVAKTACGGPKHFAALSNAFSLAQFSTVQKAALWG